MRRHGRSRLRPPAAEGAARYERERPGELVHVDGKRLGRFWTLGKRVLGPEVGDRSRRAGWRYLHLAIDDHVAPRLRGALGGRGPERVRRLPAPRARLVRRPGCRGRARPSDNGNGYRSRAWAAACAELGIERRSTRPRRPQTNGKAEALVKTVLREWAYRFAYPTSAHRARALPGYLRWYNRHRPHGSLGRKPPIGRVSQVCGSHI